VRQARRKRSVSAGEAEDKRRVLLACASTYCEHPCAFALLRDEGACPSAQAVCILGVSMRTTLLLFFGSALLIAGCSDVSDYYSTNLDDTEARELLSLVAKESDPAVRAVGIERLSEFLFRDAGPERLIAYLTTVVEQHPDDPFGALYLYLVGQTYLEQGAGALAQHYLERAVHGYADVEFKGVSIHRASLEQLVQLTPDPEKRAGFYRTLISEYSDNVDLGLLHYRIAQAYEEYGEWEGAYASYRTFLSYPDTVVPGEPNAVRQITERVDFYDSRKNWTVASLGAGPGRSEHGTRVGTWRPVTQFPTRLGQFDSRSGFRRG